jgi:hypothetical protein
MRSRAEKKIYLALISDYMMDLREQATDLSAQMKVLIAKREDTQHINELLLPILSALISLRTARDRVLLSLDVSNLQMPGRNRF